MALFFEGSDAIIKVSICLLVECEDELLACENLEELMNVLKTSLPNIKTLSQTLKSAKNEPEKKGSENKGRTAEKSPVRRRFAERRSRGCCRGPPLMSLQF